MWFEDHPAHPAIWARMRRSLWDVCRSDCGGSITKSRCAGAQPRMATSLGTLEHLPRDELPGHSVLTDELLRFVAIAARHHLCVFDGPVIPFP